MWGLGACRPAFFRAMWCTQASHGCEVGDLLGFICATLAPTEELLEETMAGHDPAGSTLCIHSVYAKPNLRQIVFDSAQRKADAVRARFG